MTGKSALYTLAVLVLTGSMAVVVLADERGMSAYGPDDFSVSAEPQADVAQPEAGEIREPMETGAVPDRTEESSFPSIYANDPAYSGDPTFWPGGP